jgi:hypothetical protein
MVKRGLLKDFFLFPDITIMCVLFGISFVYTILHLNDWSTWVALGLGMNLEQRGDSIVM